MSILQVDSEPKTGEFTAISEFNSKIETYSCKWVDNELKFYDHDDFESVEGLKFYPFSSDTIYLVITPH